MTHTPHTPPTPSTLKDSEIVFDKDLVVTITCDTYEILDDIREPGETIAGVIERLVKDMDR